MAQIELLQGDITALAVDAIVNAANSRLAGGGGVDGAIHRAAGPELLQECQRIYQQRGECAAGNAVMTEGYGLKAKHVLHAVGPIWRGGQQGEERLLAQAYLSCLEIATEHNISSLAFPNISTGIYGFPKEKAAAIALRTVWDFFADEVYALVDNLYFVCFDRENYQIYYRNMYPAP